MLELYILLVFMIVAAFIAIEVKDLLSSVVALGATGLGLSMTFIILKAPDVAITQLVVETLALVILIRATLKTDLPFSASGRWLINTTIAIGFIVSFLSVAMNALRDLPAFGFPIMKIGNVYLKTGLAETGAANVVSSVILDYRALDTLCEATVLFTAVIGVLVIVRKTGRKKEGQAIEEEND